MQSQRMEMKNEGTSLPWVHAAYHKFKNRLQNFSRMVNLQPGITQILLGNQHAREGVELVCQVLEEREKKKCYALKAHSLAS